MTFDWYDYLLYAKNINGENINQDLTLAKFRSAISRAYYATYNIAKLYLENYCQIDFSSNELKTIKEIRNGKEHAIIPLLFESSDELDIRACGARLKTLKSKRIDADYKSEKIENIKRKVEDAIKISDKIILHLELLKSGKASVNLNLLLK